jgi:branched-chain amino acid transport system substrate-binding protein
LRRASSHPTGRATIASALAIPLTLAVGLALAGCSSDGFAFRECHSDNDCRQAFGFGSVCAPNRYCAEVHPTARCASTYPDDLFSNVAQHRNAIVFASLMDHASDAHITRERAIRLALKGANGAGGLGEREFALVMCDIAASPSYDDKSRTEAAVASASFVANRLGVAAIVGPSASSDTEQVWQAVHDSGTLVMSPAATSPALSALETNTSDDNPGLLWRTAPTDALQGRVIAEDMIERKVPTVYVIREVGPYGEGLAGVFSEHYRQAGGEVSLISISSEAQAMEAASAVPAETPGEVLFVSSQQSWIISYLKAAAAQPSFGTRAIFLTDAAANQAVLTGSATAATLFPRVRGTRPAPRDPSEYVFASFIADYRAEYAGDLPTTATFSAHAFDAAWLVLYGAAYASNESSSGPDRGAITGAGIARGLRRVTMGMDVPIVPASWLSVRSAFRAGQSINVRGASGDLDYQPGTRDLAGPIEIWTIGSTDGQFTMVRQDTRTPQLN